MKNLLLITVYSLFFSAIANLEAQSIQLSDGKIGAGHLEWSPDGTMIASCTWDETASIIWISPVDGSAAWKVKLTPGISGDFYLTWSPDSKTIFFDGRDSNGPPAIFKVDIDSQGNYEKVTENGCFMPDVSPDGTKLAYMSSDGNIWTQDIDGSNKKQVSTNSAVDFHPDWSPDGSRIMFTSNRDGNNEIYTKSIAGNQLTRLTNNNYSDDRSCWSPDGNKIAFVSDRKGEDQVWIMNSDGSDSHLLTSELNTSTMPAWSPDGQKIAVSTKIGDSFFIYIINYSTTGINDEKPVNDFQLFQNYPNPFNPVTNIKFKISGNQFVRITVLDILGQEIKTLVNEEKSTGSYSITWNGLNNNNEPVSSGIYIYMLKTSNSRQVRKMILMR